MRVRYKKTGAEAHSNHFNPHGLGEIATVDDSTFIKDMDVFVNGEWKDMCQAFEDKDIIPDNHNLWFGVPKTEEDKERGYYL